MELLYISSYQFKSMGDGAIGAIPAYGNTFWQKYLDVFSQVRVLAEPIKEYLDNGTVAAVTDERIKVEIIPSITHPKDFKNDHFVRKILKEEISHAEAILIKPTSRKGMMAIKIAEQLGKPYMIELTGDLKLTLAKNPSRLKQIYGSWLYPRIKKSISHTQFGLYVTEQYLQKVYPIPGKQLGASDVYIEQIPEDIYALRLRKIEALDVGVQTNIGLIGTYHDNRKGIDTAIKALALLDSSRINVSFNILYMGKEEQRRHWYDYAKEQGMQYKLTFPTPCETTEKVLQWIDTQDLLILPSRSEGLPRCIVEAMSRACPCITSNVCGLPELINEKWLHGAEDYQRLAELLGQMLLDKNNLREAAKENWDKAHYYLKSEIKARRNAFLEEFREYCEKKA